MAAFWMCELAPTDAFNRNQLLCRESLIRGNTSKAGGVPAGRRVLEVLVVGDERDTANSLARLVDHWGYAVRVAYDGVTGLKVAAAQHPDVVLLDIVAPLISAMQVSRQLRLDFPRNECFVISADVGRPDEERAEQASEAGIDLVLMKPVDPSIYETLLMLERERINQSQPERAGGLASRSKCEFDPETLVSWNPKAFAQQSESGGDDRR